MVKIPVWYKKFWLLSLPLQDLKGIERIVFLYYVNLSKIRILKVYRHITKSQVQS